MSNLIERFGPRYFNDRFAGSVVKIDGSLYVIDYVEADRRDNDDDDLDEDYEDRDPHFEIGDVLCSRVALDGHLIEYGSPIRIPTSAFSSMDVLVVPDNGYRRLNQYQVAWMSRATVYGHGINTGNVNSDLTPFSRRIPMELGYHRTELIGEPALYFIDDPKPEHDMLPDLYGGHVANVILSNEAMIEPACIASDEPVFSVWYACSLLGNVKAGGDPYDPLAVSNYATIKELLNHD